MKSKFKYEKQIPERITFGNRRYQLQQIGTQTQIAKLRQEFMDFNRLQRSRGGAKYGYSKYKLRVKKYGDVYALYTAY